MKQNLQRTQFDYQIDRESARPGEQIFEKLVSSTSAGELIRLILLYYIDMGISPSPTSNRPLFNRRSSGTLNTKGSIKIDLVWEIINAKTIGGVQKLLVKKLGLPQSDVMEEDGKRVKEICRAILLRTARLSACAMASILTLMELAKVGGGIELEAQIDISGRLVTNFYIGDQNLMTEQPNPSHLPTRYGRGLTRDHRCKQGVDYTGNEGQG